MRIFIDCEFNSMNGQLLSMALVPLNSKAPQFYQELQIHEPIDPWVAEHVIPHMHKEKVDVPGFQCLLEGYLRQFRQVDLVCDWPEDSSYFTRILITGPGTRINTPPLTIEIRRDLDAVSEVPHHALYDAIAMRDLALEDGLFILDPLQDEVERSGVHPLRLDEIVYVSESDFLKGNTKDKDHGQKSS